jgi:hypothetical protein
MRLGRGDRHVGIVLCFGGLLAIALGATSARADEPADPAIAAPARPPILFNRWQEDWSVLADPDVPREPFDALKYIPLSPTDPRAYLSFGLNLRERFEGNDAPAFGVAPSRNTDYLISRLELHADLRLDEHVQVFTQLVSAFAPGKAMLTPVDQDRFDLEQAFVVVTEPLDGGTLKLRLGRQQFAFDLQRFVSVRDGPNLRQSYVPKDNVAEPPASMMVSSTVPPERTISGSPLETVRPLLVTPGETVMVIGRPRVPDWGIPQPEPREGGWGYPASWSEVSRAGRRGGVEERRLCAG